MKKLLLTLTIFLLALTASAQDSLAIAKSDSLYNKSLEHYNAKEYSEAIKLCNQSIEIREAISDTVSEKYIVYLSSLSFYYSESGKHNKAINVGEKVLKISENVFGKEYPGYIVTLNNLAGDYAKNGDYDKALMSEIDATQLFVKVFGKENKKYADFLNRLAYFYSCLGNYDEAIKIGTEELQVNEKIYGKNDIKYAATLSNLSSYYDALGDYGKSIKLASEALDIREEKLGKENLYYATTLGNLAVTYSKLGDYKESLRLSNEELNIIEKVLGKENSDYAASLDHLAINYYDLGDYNKAITLNKEALQIYERVLGKENFYYTNSLSNLAACYSAIKDYNNAIILTNKSLDIIEKILGKENARYALSLSRLTNVYSRMKNYDKAIEFGNEVLQITENVYGKEHPDYINSISCLIRDYSSKGSTSMIEKYSNLYFDNTSIMIINSFESLTEREREYMWGIYQSNYMIESHKGVYRHPTSRSLMKNASDAVLMGKGLLINTSQEMRNLIAERGDSVTLALYDKMRMNRLMLNRLYETPIADRHMSTDSLERVANELERQLLEKSQEYGDYTRNLMIKWQDVQRALGAKDVAVEFVSFDLNEDSTMYVAYLNKPGIDCPIFVPLFEEKQLKTRLTIPKDHSTQEGKMLAVADAYLPSQQVSELVWEPLAQYLDGAESIYFAPSGELYNLAIESLPDWENSTQLMSDRWKGLCRVSSTREIAINRDRQPINSSVTYGGLKYDMNADLLTADSKKYGSQASSLETSSLMAMVKGQSGDTWRDMPITLDEAASVHESLNKAGVDDTPYLEEAGTEASFKALSRQRKNMMFLSTHGFFWNTDEAKKHRREHTLQFISLGNDDRHQSVEDMAMTRSGLLFSGANYAWQGNELPDGVDDGFLTAKEISQLDLRGLGLVVLSACQTGLGDVSGEGVFGLQRGFKKAGAQSILMSLWEVNAYSTKLLMTEFCKNVFEKKMTKRDALKAAQETVKNFTGDPESLATKGINITSHGVDKNKKDKKTKQQTEETITQPASDNHPFAHPYYWAGFILLDALD